MMDTGRDVLAIHWFEFCSSLAILILTLILLASEGCMTITNTQYIYVTGSNDTSVGAPEQAKPVSIPTNATIPASAW